MENLHYEARGTFRASPAQLWPLLADTARVNRVIGLPPLRYRVTPAENGGSRVEAELRVLGFPVARYTEHPFRWEFPKGFVVVRDFHGGPLRRVRAGTTLTPVEGGTEVCVYGDFVPGNAIGREMIRRVLGPRSVHRALDQCRIFDEYLAGRAPDPFPQLRGDTTLPSWATEAGQQLIREGADPKMVERLQRHLLEAGDEEVVKMRPFELADRWGFDRRETLILFLRAATSGLVVMSWDVLCPNCRIAKAEYVSLRQLKDQAHCDTCNITFDASFDRSVEVRFSVAPGIRKVAQQAFCIGGPMNTPHILAQAELEPAAQLSLDVMLKPGAHRLRTRPGRGQLVLDVEPSGAGEDGPAGADGLTVIVNEDRVEPPGASLPPGARRLELRNATGRPQVVMLEDHLWPETVATAALVSTIQEFRDLFSSEVLAPGLLLGVESLAFMFTDLAGSTAMYQAIGQARAFRLVQDHFAVLVAAIAAHEGALVKTIGDAVMAVFPSGTKALEAGIQIQRDIRDLSVPDVVDPAHFVKVALHTGPCLAVTLNDRLDYFGTTVNTASRIEHECRGGQILASLVTCRSASAMELLEKSGAQLEEEVVRLRGVTEPVPVYRITLPT